jgi:hypothetical protein
MSRIAITVTTARQKERQKEEHPISRPRAPAIILDSEVAPGIFETAPKDSRGTTLNYVYDRSEVKTQF